MMMMTMTTAMIIIRVRSYTHKQLCLSACLSVRSLLSDAAAQSQRGVRGDDTLHLAQRARTHTIIHR